MYGVHETHDHGFAFDLASMNGSHSDTCVIVTELPSSQSIIETEKNLQMGDICR